MSKHVAVQETGTELTDLAERVMHTGERIVLERGGRPLAAVVSLEDLARLEETGDPHRTERQRLLDELVRMDDEAGLYAQEAVEAVRILRR